MRGRALVSVVLTITFGILAGTVQGGLTAFAVPSALSADTWTSVDSGWAGPLSISGPLDPPYLAFDTVSTPTGLLWQAWGDFDPRLPPGTQDTTAIATRTLAAEMTQGQTFRVGLEIDSGGFVLGNVGPNNSVTAGMSIGVDTTYRYHDSTTGLGFGDTGIPAGTPVDVRITWDNTVTGAYSGSIAIIGSDSPPFTWSGEMEGTSGTPTDPFDGINHLNGFYVSHHGSAAEPFGMRYIEVGSGALPDPSTLVPEPQSLALIAIAAAAIVRRRR